MFITFSGLDGSGKTTQLDLFTQYLKENNHRFKRLRMYEDISTSAFIRKIRRKRSNKVPIHKSTNRTYRYDKNRKDPNLVFIRKFTYVADLLIFAIKRFYYQYLHKQTIVTDRYLYDSLANLFNTESEIYIKLMLKLIPQPDMAIFLDVEPDVAFKRKPEYPPKYYYERRKAYLSIFDKLESGFVVQSDTIERTEKTVQHAVQQKLVSNGISLKGDRNSFYVSHILKTILGANNLKDELCYIYKNKSDFKNVINTLNKNVATVRYIEKLNAAANNGIKEKFKPTYNNKLNRLRKGYEIAEKITKSFETEGVPIMCIKTVDNYPDIGHDFDFYTDALIQEVDAIMHRHFTIKTARQSFADKLASKKSYKIEGYPGLEMHCGKLGQVGEENLFSKELIPNRRKLRVNSYHIFIPRIEHTLILRVFQRMYRHFNIRIADVHNTVELIKNNRIDWLYLEDISRRYGIWLGVVSFINEINKIYTLYVPVARLDLPANVAIEPHGLVTVQKMFFRFRMTTTGAKLYSAKFLHNVKHMNFYSVTRSLIIVPLSIAHFILVKLFKKEIVW